jgi:type IV fimbrial biogenesis protein FimT
MLAPHRPGGFTLIELMIALVILGIALALGVPGISVWTQNAQIRTGAEGIFNGLQLARTEAVRRNANVAFTLDNPTATGGTGWTVKVVNTEEVVQVAPSSEGTRNVTLKRIPVTATTATFDGFGRLATTPTNLTHLTQVDIDSAVLAAGDSRDLRVVIVSGSDVRMCDPNVTDNLDPRKCPP